MLGCLKMLIGSLLKNDSPHAANSGVFLHSFRTLEQAKA